MPLTNGYSTGSPMRRANARNAVGSEGLVAEEHDEVLEPRAADLGHGLVGEVGREVDAADLRAERAGDRQHLMVGRSRRPSSRIRVASPTPGAQLAPEVDLVRERD